MINFFMIIANLTVMFGYDLPYRLRLFYHKCRIRCWNETNIEIIKKQGLNF